MTTSHLLSLRDKFYDEKLLASADNEQVMRFKFAHAWTTSLIGTRALERTKDLNVLYQWLSEDYQRFLDHCDTQKIKPRNEAVHVWIALELCRIYDDLDFINDD